MTYYHAKIKVEIDLVVEAHAPEQIVEMLQTALNTTFHELKADGSVDAQGNRIEGIVAVQAHVRDLKRHTMAGGPAPTAVN